MNLDIRVTRSILPHLWAIKDHAEVRLLQEANQRLLQQIRVNGIWRIEYSEDGRNTEVTVSSVNGSLLDLETE